MEQIGVFIVFTDVQKTQASVSFFKTQQVIPALNQIVSNLLTSKNRNKLGQQTCGIPQFPDKPQFAL